MSAESLAALLAFLTRHLRAELAETDAEGRSALFATLRVVERIGRSGLVRSNDEAGSLARDILIELAQPYRRCDGFLEEWDVPR